MSIPSPKIDPRTYDQIVAQTEALAQKYTDWRPRSDGQPEAGRALIRIFSRMAALVSDRLNQVPDKNFLAFLDLIGTQIQAPQPARVPLTFTLVENSPVDAFVPAGTQVAAPAAEGEDEVVFELEHELVVMRSQLQAVFVRQPRQNRYSDRSLAAQGKIADAYPVFVADQAIAHHLYVACDDLLTLPGEKKLTLTLASPGGRMWQQLPVTWSYYTPDTETWTVIKGIVEGLTVVLDPILPQITIRPGRAINTEGVKQTLTLKTTQIKSLGDYRNQTVLVLLRPDGANAQPDGANARIDLQRAEAEFFDTTTQICLACLKVSNEGQVSPAPWSSLRTSSDPWRVTFQALPPLVPHAVNQRSAAWLQARLDTPLPLQPDATLPQITAIQTEVQMMRNSLAPDLCLFNTTPLDLGKPFYPLGEQPRFNDTFYLANQRVFSQPGAVVVLQVVLTGPKVKDGEINLVWEIWTGVRWEELGRSTGNNHNVKNSSEFSDGTKALTVGATVTTDITVNPTNFNEEAGLIKFKIPNTIAPSTLNGEENFWIRTRIVHGNYGQPTRTEKRAGTGTETTPPAYDLLPADLAPPIIESLTIAYTLTPAAKDATCLTYNDFAYARPTGAFTPFTPARDRDPALYLGFDAPFPNRPLTLYLQVESLVPGKLTDRTSSLLDSEARKQQNQAGQPKIRVEQVQGFQAGQAVRIAPGSSFQEDHEIVAIQPEPSSVAGELTLKANLAYTHAVNTRIQRIPAAPRLLWEYASAKGWKSLGAIDETELLTQRGLVRFIGPEDAVQQSEFGQSLYWLRWRWESGEFLVPPQLRQVLTNTTWAAQAVTLTNEVLGSSSGNPSQRFLTRQYPVLADPILEVREDLSPAEQAAILASDLTRLNVLQDETGAVEEIWVRWQEVTDFYGSGAGDRHYILNHLTGDVQFGNGQQGRVPPLGRQNIRLRQYRTGGGERSNKPTATITELKTALPYISAVVNQSAASGAADQESLEQVKERGPKQLRHRERAVTVQDLEDLAFAASPDVARVRAIPPAFQDGLKWLPIYHIPLPNQTSSSNLVVQINWTENVPHLLVSLYGPGQATPRSQQRIPKNETVTFPLSPEPALWRLAITNPHPQDVSGNGLITYTGGSQTIEFSGLSSTPHSEVVDAGRVDLIIVPYGLENQPTPSLGLLNRVEEYLQARCVPTLALHVTEPDWVKVTVNATLVPKALDGADATCDRALRRLIQFLHPLTGGPSGRGWAFGRKPQESDIYALLESVEGIDFVKPTLQQTLENNTPKLTQLPLIQTRPAANLSPNFLIYSGAHSLQLQLP
jgi:hypothetical protein